MKISNTDLKIYGNLKTPKIFFSLFSISVYFSFSKFYLNLFLFIKMIPFVSGKGDFASFYISCFLRKKITFKQQTVLCKIITKHNSIPPSSTLPSKISNKVQISICNNICSSLCKKSNQGHYITIYYEILFFERRFECMCQIN